MAKSIIDLTSTGLVIGDITVDWINQISNDASVALTSHTLTERGNGIYVYDNPNVTEDSDFRLHETATPANSVVGILSLADGDLALDSTVAKEATLSTVDGKADTIQADLNIPSQYKADVSSLALETTAQSILTETNSHPTLAEIEATTVLAKEATLADATYGLAAIQALVDAIDTSAELQARFDEIKGVGWTTETLATLQALIGSLDLELDDLATATELDAVKTLAQQAATGVVGNYYIESDQLILKDTSDVEIARWDLSPDASNPINRVRA